MFIVFSDLQLTPVKPILQEAVFLSAPLKQNASKLETERLMEIPHILEVCFKQLVQPFL